MKIVFVIIMALIGAALVGVFDDKVVSMSEVIGSWALLMSGIMLADAI